MLHTLYNRSNEKILPPQDRDLGREVSLGHLVEPFRPAESQVTDGDKSAILRRGEQVALEVTGKKLPGVLLKVIEHLQLKSIHLSEHSCTVVHNPF